MNSLAETTGTGVAALPICEIEHASFAVAGRFADRPVDGLIALKGGRPLTSGPSSDLMRADTLEEIHGIPMGIVPHPRGGTPTSFAY